MTDIKEKPVEQSTEDRYVNANLFQTTRGEILGGKSEKPEMVYTHIVGGALNGFYRPIG